jgi:hypothetical protein
MLVYPSLQDKMLLEDFWFGFVGPWIKYIRGTQLSGRREWYT